MFGIFTVPDPALYMASIADFSGPLFGELLPVIGVAVGLMFAGAVASRVLGWTLKGAYKLTGKGRR